MCARMTKDDLEVFKNKVDSAHVDYVLADDVLTFDKLVIAVQDMYMALLEERAVMPIDTTNS